MLAETPVRERLDLSAEQEKQLQSVMANCAAIAEERLSGETQPSKLEPDWETDAKKQVEAILTPQQLTALNEINFRRQVALALSYPEKRKTVEITTRQAAGLKRLDKENLKHLHRIDRETLAKAISILSPRQREQLRVEIDRRGSQ